MLFVVRFFLAFLTAYFYGRVIYCSFCSSKVKNNIISKFHSFFLGLGLTSISFWFYTIATNGFNYDYHGVEICVVTIIYLFLYFKSKQNGKNNISYLLLRDKSLINSRASLVGAWNSSQRKWKDSLYGEKTKKKETYKEKRPVLDYVAIIILFLISFLCFVKSLRYPEGEWDAVGIWNLKAKFLACGNDSWSGMFSDNFNYAHRNYPLFLSCIIARYYNYVGIMTNIIPLIFTCFFSVSCFVLPYYYLKNLKNTYYAFFFICILSFSPFILEESSKQNADIPLSVFFLVSLYELILFNKKDSKLSPILCVIFASLCFWMKNEGIPWFILYILLVVYYCYKQNRFTFQTLFHKNFMKELFLKDKKRKKYLYKFFKNTVIILCFVTPILLARLTVSFLSNEVDDFPIPISFNIMGIINIKYYFLIFGFIWNYIKAHIWILIIPFYIILRFKDKDYWKYKHLLMLMFFMHLIYVLIYFFINDDLEYHLTYSFPRITTHFLPSLAFLGCLLFDFKRDEKS